MSAPRAGVPHTKGLGFVNARAQVVARAGEEGWAAVVARLPPGDRAILEGLVPVGWYPIESFARLLRAMEAELGNGDFAVSVQAGRFGAERDLTTIHRIFLRMFRPSFAVEKMAELWPRYQDSGRWTIDESSGLHLFGRLDDWGGNLDVILCYNLMGYVGRCLELAGMRHVLIDHPKCRAIGESTCLFRARWGDAARDTNGPSSSNASGPRSPRAEAPSGTMAKTPRDAAPASSSDVRADETARGKRR